MVAIADQGVLLWKYKILLGQELWRGIGDRPLHTGWPLSWWRKRQIRSRLSWLPTRDKGTAWLNVGFDCHFSHLSCLLLRLCYRARAWHKSSSQLLSSRAAPALSYMCVTCVSITEINRKEHDMEEKQSGRSKLCSSCWIQWKVDPSHFYSRATLHHPDYVNGT